MTHFCHLLVAAVAVLTFGLAGAPAARAENPGPAAAAPPAAAALPAADAPEIEREVYWRGRAENARERVAAAQSRVHAANVEVSRMRRRNHPRGEARAAVFASRDAARLELDRARDHLETELPREAEEAGADLAWLRN
jgi:hypothetical protein